MKKIFVRIVLFIVLFSLLSTCVLAEDTVSLVQFTFEDKIDVKDAYGVELDGPYNGHGNHQTRIVHTSHGDYLSSTSGNSRSGKSLVNGFRDGLWEVSVMKVPAGSTEATLVLQHTILYQTSHISLIVDKDENVWAGLVYENSYRNFRDQHKSGVFIELYRIDAETDQVTFYSTILSDIDINKDGVGYSSFYYDESIDSIVVMMSDNLANSTYVQSYMYWKVFDCSTNTWDSTYQQMPVSGGRNSYPFFAPDGNGGLIMITNRNPSVYYPDNYTPEVANSDGIPMEDKFKYFRSGRRTVEYCFDQINAYVIPDIRSSENISHFIVYDTDRSRIKGTLEERLTPEFRKINEYPNIANNNGGDVYLDKDGLLHVTLEVSYFKYAWDWEKTESRWVHVVFDPSTGEKLSESQVWDELADNKEYYARIYVDPFTEEMFIVSTVNNKIVIKKAIGSPTEGYTYVEVARSQGYSAKNGTITTDTLDCLCISSWRSNSTVDGILSAQTRAPVGYDLIRIQLSYTVGTQDNPIKITDPDQLTSLKALANGTTYYSFSSAEPGSILTLQGDDTTAVSLNGETLHAVNGVYTVSLDTADAVLAISNSDKEMKTYTASATVDLPEETEPTDTPEDPAEQPDVGILIAIAAGIFLVTGIFVLCIKKKRNNR